MTSDDYSFVICDYNEGKIIIYEESLMSKHARNNLEFGKRFA